jgi:hypothetical protein
VLVDAHASPRITSSPMSAAAPRLLCLGEALVDLIGEQWVALD